MSRQRYPSSSRRELHGSRRDIHLDLLKVLGLFCIILAHAGPPELVLALRSFDVPLMVIAAGAAYFHSNSAKTRGAWQYIEQRTFRLLAPTWIFLVIFFMTMTALFAAAGRPYPFTPARMFFSFALTLQSGIGYVWIIRVLILVSVLAPLFLALSRRLGQGAYLAVLLALYSGYEAARLLTAGVQGPLANLFLNPVLWYLLPYGCLFGLGVLLPRMSTRAILSALSAAVLAIVAGVWSGQIQNFPFGIEQHKYPAGLPYVAYGIAVSLLLFLAVRRLPLANGRLRKWIMSTSSSSLWIYLWHIFFVFLWSLVSFKLPVAARHFLVAFAVVTVLPMIVVRFQHETVRHLLTRIGLEKKNEELLRGLFLC